MEIREKIEAIVFFSGEPITVDILAETLEVDKKEIIENIEKLIIEKYSKEDSGIELVLLGDMVQFVAKRETMKYIRYSIKEQILDLQKLLWKFYRLLHIMKI